MKITKIEIEKFRALSDVSYDLKDVNIYSGMNELGKTTINNFIMWLLFDLSNNDNNLNDNEDVTNAYVKGSVTFDNGDVVERNYKQVWKDVAGEMTAKPSKNEFFINGASYKAKEFKVEILKMFNLELTTKVKDLNLVKLFTDVLYMEEITPIQFREFFSEILNLTNEDDLELLNSDKQYAKLIDPLQEQKFDIKNVISVNRNKLKVLNEGSPRDVSIDVLRTQISELNASFNENEYNKVVDNKTALENELHAIEVELDRHTDIECDIANIPKVEERIKSLKLDNVELEKSLNKTINCPNCNHELRKANDSLALAEISANSDEIKQKEYRLGQLYESLECSKEETFINFNREEKRERHKEVEVLLDVVGNELFELQVAKSNHQKIDNMKVTLKNKMSEKANAEIIIALAKEFRKVRNQKLETKLSNIFGNEVFVSLREKNKFDDEYSDTGYAKVGNTDYKRVNTATRYLTGLTFIECLKRFLNVGDLPIFFDKSNDLDSKNMKALCDKTKSQIFSTRVTDSETLTNEGFDR